MLDSIKLFLQYEYCATLNSSKFSIFQIFNEIDNKLENFYFINKKFNSKNNNDLKVRMEFD